MRTEESNRTIYQMGIKYMPGKKHGNADTLSRRICTTANNLIVPLKILAWS